MCSFQVKVSGAIPLVMTFSESITKQILNWRLFLLGSTTRRRSILNRAHTERSRVYRDLYGSKPRDLDLKAATWGRATIQLPWPFSTTSCGTIGIAGESPGNNQVIKMRQAHYLVHLLGSCLSVKRI